MTPKTKIPVEISARHVHLSQEHLEELFGKNYKLKKQRKLSQPRTFASEETVILINKDKEIKNVRILGPSRKETQVELSKTDCIELGIDAPIRLSGDHKNTQGIKIKGPKGIIDLNQGVIIAQRHLHLSPEQAKELNLKEHQLVSIKILGERSVTFHNVIVRVDENYDCSFHLDTDEGNAAGINNGTFGEMVR